MTMLARGEAPAPPTLLFRVVDRAGPAAALYGVMSFVAVGLLGFGKGGGTSWMNDFYWYYAGGRCFQQGHDMYDVACFRSTLNQLYPEYVIAGLPYPPHFAVVARGLSGLSVYAATHLFMILSALVAVAMVFVVVVTERKARQDTEIGKPLNHLWAVALVLGSSGIWGTLWLGQVSLVLAFLMWIAFQQLEKGHDVTAGLLLAVVSMKPQMAFLLFLWILLNGRFLALGVAAIAAGILGIYGFAEMGVLGSVKDWLATLALYQKYPVNDFGNISVMGLPSLLAVFGIYIPLWAALVFGALIVVALRIRGRLDPFSPMALATLLSLQMLIYSRPIDTILLAPAFALFWPNSRSSSTHILLFIGAVAFFCFPQQIVTRLLDFAVAGHFRTILLIGLAAAFVPQAFSNAKRFEYRGRRREVIAA